MTMIPIDEKMSQQKMSNTKSTRRTHKDIGNRPPTPYYRNPASSGNAFTFDNDHMEFADEEPTSGCVRIALTELMETFNPSSSTSRPMSPRLTGQEDETNTKKQPFLQNNLDNIGTLIRQTLTKNIKQLHCSTNASNCKNSKCDRLDTSDKHMDLETESSTFDFYDLEKYESTLRGVSSWNTLETAPTESSSLETYGALPSNPSHPSQSSRPDSLISPSTSKQVQFQYPPITSIHLRPRTESDEVQELFFAAEELEQMEDDRMDTKVADDVETLAVGPSQDLGSMMTSSTITASLDGIDEHEGDSSQLLFLQDGGASRMFESGSGVRSPSSQKEDDRKKKRLVRGVQIMLREKSLG